MAILAGVQLLTPRGEAPATADALLTQVQTMGRLQTVQHNYNGVLRHTTAQEAEGGWNAVPGVASLVHTTTRNDALITYRAQVRAGVDLRMVKVSGDPEQGFTVTLPPSSVELAGVQARAEWVRPGFLWKDANVTLDAERVAGADAIEKARTAGIADAAQTQAEEELRRLLEPLTEAEITFN